VRIVSIRDRLAVFKIIFSESDLIFNQLNLSNFIICISI